MSGFAGCLAVFAVMLVTPVMPDEVHDSGDPSVQIFFRDPWPPEPTSEVTTIEPTTRSQVTAVGGACPSHMCENGGSCVLVDGKMGCRCALGFIGHQCQDTRLDVACDRHGMALRVVKDVLSRLGLNGSALQTSNRKCRAEESPLHISITLTHHNHSQCGTRVKVNGTHLIYSNELSTESASQPPETPGNSISRSTDLRITFSCVYHYDRIVSLPYPLLTSASLVTFVVKEGRFNVSMTLHPSGDFLDPYNRPPVIPLSDRLFVQLQILGGGPQDFFTLRLEECWATPGLHHAGDIRHPIISSGTANDSTVAMLASDNQWLSRFSLQMFHFVKFPEFFLHCRVWLHQANATDLPKSRNGRHTRDLSDPYRKVVSCGPIRPSRSSVSSIGKPESGLSPLLVPASSAAALILLLLGLVTIAKVLQRREKLRIPPPICTIPPSIP